MKIYCKPKIGKIVKHENIANLSFSQLRYIRGIYSKYFQNSICEAFVSSVTKNQLPDDLSMEYYIYSMYIISNCI